MTYRTMGSSLYIPSVFYGSFQLCKHKRSTPKLQSNKYRILSMYITANQIWRYPARRQERTRYSTIKPRLAFTLSGFPVAVYPPQGITSSLEMDVLSIDSLQERPDSDADDTAYHRCGIHSSTGHINESQVSLLSDREIANLAMHDEITAAINRPIRPPQHF